MMTIDDWLLGNDVIVGSSSMDYACSSDFDFVHIKFLVEFSYIVFYCCIYKLLKTL